MLTDCGLRAVNTNGISNMSADDLKDLQNVFFKCGNNGTCVLYVRKQGQTVGLNVDSSLKKKRHVAPLDIYP